MFEPKYIDAVQALVGGTTGVGGKSDGPIEKIYYPESFTPPSEEVIQAKLKELQDEYKAKQWHRDRVEQYPSIVDQLDLLWHAIDSGTLDNRDHRNKFYSTLKTVKTNNPKG